MARTFFALALAFFDRPYPFEKLDFVSVPIFGGAMENPGLITISRRGLLAKRAEENPTFDDG